MDEGMEFWSVFFYKFQRLKKVIKIYLLLAGPGLIVMLADNDAGGITTYTVLVRYMDMGLSGFSSSFSRWHTLSKR
jgi:hypothetical protein